MQNSFIILPWSLVKSKLLIKFGFKWKKKKRKENWNLRLRTLSAKNYSKWQHIVKLFHQIYKYTYNLIYIQVFLNIQHNINVYIVFYLYTHINDELVPYMYMTKSALSLFFVRKIRDKKCEWDRCDIPVLNIEYKCISQSKNHHRHINILHIEV